MLNTNALPYQLHFYCHIILKFHFWMKMLWTTEEQLCSKQSDSCIIARTFPLIETTEKSELQMSWPTDSTSKLAGLQLTSSQLKNLSNQHETRFSEGVPFSIHLLSIVWQVTILFCFFLGRQTQHGYALQFPILLEWI